MPGLEEPESTASEVEDPDAPEQRPNSFGRRILKNGARGAALAGDAFAKAIGTETAKRIIEVLSRHV